MRDIPEAKLYAAPYGVLKTPTVAFRVEGYTPREVTERLAQEGFFVADGHFYASTLARKLGIHNKGGWIRAGLAPYSTEEEVEGFVRSLQRFVSRP